MPGLYNSVVSQVALNSVLRTNGTVTGITVDRGSDNVSVLFVIQTATLTDGQHVISVHDSDDNSSFGAAAVGQQGANITTVITNDDTFFELGYVGPKRYCRLNVVTTGTTTGGVLGAIALKFGGRKPVVRA